MSQNPYMTVLRTDTHQLGVNNGNQQDRFVFAWLLTAMTRSDVAMERFCAWLRRRLADFKAGPTLSVGVFLVVSKRLS